MTQVRDDSGYAAPVTAGFAFQEFEWSGDDHGVISHKETAALNRFYGTLLLPAAVLDVY